MSSHDFLEDVASAGSMTRSASMSVSPTTTSPRTGFGASRRSSLPAPTVKRAGRDEQSTQTDIRDVLWGVDWASDPTLRRQKESILPIDSTVVVEPTAATTWTERCGDGEDLVSPIGPSPPVVTGLPSADECVFLRATHNRVRQFISLIQVWLEDPKKIDFVGEWVGQQHPSRVAELFRRQVDEEDTLLIALKEELKHVMRQPDVSDEEKVERCRVFADRQKMIFLRRAERVKESSLLLQEHHRKMFAHMNSLTIEIDEEECDVMVGAETLASSVVGLLGKLFVFLRCAVEETRSIPSGSELLPLQLFPGGARQRTVYGLDGGLHESLDAVVLPRDFEELKLIVKGNELPDLYKLKYSDKWDFGTDELDYLREKFLKQHAAEELRKINAASKKKKDEMSSAIEKELQKMRSSATQQIKALEDSVTMATANASRASRSRQGSGVGSMIGGATPVVLPPSAGGSTIASREVSPTNPALSPPPLQMQLTRPGSSGFGKPPMSPAIPPGGTGPGASASDWYPAPIAPVQAAPDAVTLLACAPLVLDTTPRVLPERTGSASASNSALPTGRDRGGADGSGSGGGSNHSEASECLKAAVGAAISPADAPLVTVILKKGASSAALGQQKSGGTQSNKHTSKSAQPDEVSPAQTALTGWIDANTAHSDNETLVDLGPDVSAGVSHDLPDGHHPLSIVGAGGSSFRRPLQREASQVKKISEKIKSSLQLKQQQQQQHVIDNVPPLQVAEGIRSVMSMRGRPQDAAFSPSTQIGGKTTVPSVSDNHQGGTQAAASSDSFKGSVNITPDTKTAAAAASLAHARDQLSAVVDTLLTTQPSRARRQLTSSIRANVASAPTSLLDLADAPPGYGFGDDNTPAGPQKKLYVANAKSSNDNGGRVDYVVSPARRASSSPGMLPVVPQASHSLPTTSPTSPVKRLSPARRGGDHNAPGEDDADMLARVAKPLLRGGVAMDADPLTSLSQKLARRRDLATPVSQAQRKPQLPPRASTPQQTVAATTTTGRAGVRESAGKLQPLRAVGSASLTAPSVTSMSQMVLPVKSSAAVRYGEELSARATANSTAEQLMVEAMLHGRLDRLQLLTPQHATGGATQGSSDDVYGVSDRISPPREPPREHVLSSGANGDVPFVDVPLVSTRVEAKGGNEMIFGAKAADVPCLIPISRKPPTPTTGATRAAQSSATATSMLLGQGTVEPPSSTRNIFAAQPLVHTAVLQQKQHRSYLGDDGGDTQRFTTPHNGSVDFSAHWDSSQQPVGHDHAIPSHGDASVAQRANQSQQQQKVRSHNFADHVANLRGTTVAATTPLSGTIAPFPASAHTLHQQQQQQVSQQQQHSWSAKDEAVDSENFVHYAVAVDRSRGGQTLTVAKPAYSYLA